MKRTLAVAKLSVVTEYCQPICNASFIAFNNTKEFIDDYAGFPQRFFVNSSKNSTAFQEFCEDKLLNSYSFEDIAMHELGHIFGFAHFDTNPNDEYINKYDCSLGLTGIMYSINPSNKDNKGLSIYDKCMFKKLYCPETVSVQVFISIEDQNEIYPNPSYEKLFIKSNLIYPVKYTIYNQLGFPALWGNTTNEGTINITSLTTGAYFIKINDTGKLVKFIKQ